MFLLLFKCTKRAGNFHQALNSLCQTGERTKNGGTREKGRTCKHLFKYLSPPTSRNSVCRVKIAIVKICVLEGFVRSPCLLDPARAKPSDWRKCLLKLLKLINHRLYQKLVYRNELLKTMLTGPTSPSPPSPRATLAQLFSIRFSYSL